MEWPPLLTREEMEEVVGRQSGGKRTGEEIEVSLLEPGEKVFFENIQLTEDDLKQIENNKRPFYKVSIQFLCSIGDISQEIREFSHGQM